MQRVINFPFVTIILHGGWICEGRRRRNKEENIIKYAKGYYSLYASVHVKWCKYPWRGVINFL